MKRRCIKLSTSSEVRKALARVANMVLNNELSPSTANAVVYCSNAVLAAIRADETEKRLSALEQTIADYKNA